MNNRIHFTKMQAYGNDYVYIETLTQELTNLGKLAQFVSKRHFGICSDGMILICPSDTADFRMRVFNPDGTEAEMCGNAVRSVGMFVFEKGFTDKTEITVETLGGIKKYILSLQKGAFQILPQTSVSQFLKPLKFLQSQNQNALLTKRLFLMAENSAQPLYLLEIHTVSALSTI